MHTISGEAFDAIEAEFRARRNTILIGRLRGQMAVVPREMSDAEAIATIEPLMGDAKALGFAGDDNDLLRFLALAFLPDAARHDRLLSDSFQRCLGDAATHPSDRLDFAYKHIVPKAIRFRKR